MQVAVDTRQQFKDATKVGKGPDIVVGAHDWLGELVQENTVAPISLSADTAAKFAKTSIDAAKFNGQNYGVPYAVENIALMRNTDLAPDAPKTMDELVKTGTEIKAKSGGKVTNVLIQQVGKTGNAYYTYPYLSAFGGGIFGADVRRRLRPEQGHRRQRRLDQGRRGARRARQGRHPLDERRRRQRRGPLRRRQGAVLHHRPVGDDERQEGQHQVRHQRPAHPRAVAARCSRSSVSSSSTSAPKAKNASIAQEFVTNYITKKDVQLELFNALGRPPALTEALNEVSASNADVKAFFEAGKDSKPMPNIPAMNSVWGPLGQASADVIAGKAAAESRFKAAQAEIVANIKKG